MQCDTYRRAVAAIAVQRRVRIATRSSPLALSAARAVADALETAAVVEGAVEFVPVVTSGDIGLSTPISQLAGRGVFVTEVQSAVLEGRADLAVHSAKDMRSEPTPGLTLGGCLARGDVRDALVGRALDDLPSGGVVATGSQRRECQLAALRPDLRFRGLRGNMARRLTAATGDGIDAVVVAVAALARLGESHRLAQVFDPEVLVPQAGQGASAIEHRTDDATAAAAVARIVDAATTRCVRAVRAFLRTLGGGCDLPTGACAVIDAAGAVQMTAMLATPDRTRIERATRGSADGEALGEALARDLQERVGGSDD